MLQLMDGSKSSNIDDESYFTVSDVEKLCVSDSTSSTIMRCPQCQQEVLVRDGEDKCERMKMHIIAFHLDDPDVDRLCVSNSTSVTLAQQGSQERKQQSDE